MRYFQDTSGQVHGFDPSQPGDMALMEQLTEGWTEVTGNWPPAPMLTDLQADQIVTVTASYLVASSQQVSYTSQGGVTKPFQADDASQSLVQKSLAGFSATQTVPAGFYWLSADNTKVPFTYADLQGLAAAMLQQGWVAFQKLQTLKAQIRSATTVAAVQSVVWS